MRPLVYLQKLAMVVATCVLTTACSDTVDIIEGLKPVDPLFSSYVSLGNSITAGYQSSGINDSTQQESYAVMLAEQMNTRFAYPALNDPGCPPPIIDFQTQQRVGNGTSTTCNTRNSNSITDRLNNVAVPGATIFDPTAPSTQSSNALTTFILGGKTQVDRARDANPTFVSAWIGNNDVLAAAVTGVVTPNAMVQSPGVTPVNTFIQQYDAMMTGLSDIPSIRGGVLIGVVNVTNAPILFPVAAFGNPAFRAGFNEFVRGPNPGDTLVVSSNCNTNPTTLVSFAIVPVLRGSPSGPRLISCVKNQPAGAGEFFILDAADIAVLQGAVTAYNAHIKQIADTKGWAYWDPNPALQQLRATGCIATVPNLASTTQPYGPCISLDGAHPARQAHIEVVKGLVQVINAKYGTEIPAP